MDSFNYHDASSNTIIIRKRKAEEGFSLNIASKKARFWASYNRNQNKSFPDSIIYFLTKNPSSWKMYQKLVESCKYFFIQNPILVISQICFASDKLSSYVHGKEVDLKNISCKIWITDELELNQTAAKRIASCIIPRLYQVDVTNLCLYGQTIGLQEFLLLSSNVEEITLNWATVINDNGTIVLFEDLVKVLPNIKMIFIHSTYSSIVTSNTVEELLTIPHFSKIDYISLSPIPEAFHIETFFLYAKGNKHTAFYLYFCDPLSQAYKIRLKSTIEEILASEGSEYRAPVINYRQQPAYTYERLIELSRNFVKL